MMITFFPTRRPVKAFRWMGDDSSRASMRRFEAIRKDVSVAYMGDRCTMVITDPRKVLAPWEAPQPDKHLLVLQIFPGDWIVEHDDKRIEVMPTDSFRFSFEDHPPHGNY